MPVQTLKRQIEDIPSISFQINYFKMIMNDYQFVCKIEDLNESEGQRFYINDTDIAVFKINNRIYVVDNICPHQQTASIYEGFIEDNCVICPLHGWKFNLADGKMENGSRGLESYEMKIENGKIFAKVFPKKINW